MTILTERLNQARTPFMRLTGITLTIVTPREAYRAELWTHSL